MLFSVDFNSEDTTVMLKATACAWHLERVNHQVTQSWCVYACSAVKNPLPPSHKTLYRFANAEDRALWHPFADSQSGGMSSAELTAHPEVSVRRYSTQRISSIYQYLMEHFRVIQIFFINFCRKRLVLKEFTAGNCKKGPQLVGLKEVDLLGSLLERDKGDI